MAEVRIVPALRRHVATIANRIRDVDRAECEAFGHSPRVALRTGIACSELAWTALVDGRPEAMFGLVVRSAVAGSGTPWFLGTDAVYQQGRALMLWGPAMVARMVDSTPTLSNLVSADNGPAIRLLRKWGFDVGGEQQMIGGLAFIPFGLRHV